MITQAIRGSQRAIIPYVTAGYPDLDTTGAIIRALAEAGAAAIEIGIPFSDPMADGPVLQQASHAALTAGFRLGELLERLPDWVAACPVPLIAMSYSNPLMRHGLEETLARLKASGMAGVIIPDAPADAAELFAMTAAAGLDLIRLVAPTTPPGRRDEILAQCRGFVYAVAVKGVTGARSTIAADLEAQVRTLKDRTDLPVCVGFGVSGKAQVDAILGFADGAIVGSALMQALMQAGDPVAAAGEFLGRI